MARTSTSGPTHLQASPHDLQFMRRALRLAARGRGRAEPNPMVGCVIVRNGRIIGEGFHRHFGGPHAEVEALRHCAGEAAGATVYVTLEPCCHQGKTPPCVEALRAARVKRVVAALRDPNPRVSGRGFRRLRSAGIAVDVGVLAEEAAELIAPFAKLIRTGRPWVILKWAQSLDGKLATRTGAARWISDEAMRAHAHRRRGIVDAVLVGSATALADDPELTCRVGSVRRKATRVVLDTRLRLPSESKLVRTAREVPTWVFCGARVPFRNIRSLEAAGCVVNVVPEGDGGVRLAAVLDKLGAVGMTNVLVEGGGRLLGQVLDERLADEIQVYVAPILIGGRSAAGALNAEGVADLCDAPRLCGRPRMQRLGSGWLCEARLSTPH